MGRCCGRQSRDKPALETFLEQATKFNLTSHDLYKQAVALKKRMEVHACMHACNAEGYACVGRWGIRRYGVKISQFTHLILFACACACACACV